MSDLRNVLRSVIVRSPMEYELGGATFRVSAFASPAFGGHAHAHGHGHAHAPAAPELPPLVNDLQSRLYEYAYTRALNGRIEEVPQPQQAPQSLEDELTAANTTRERWEGGWQIVQFAPTGAIYARKGTMTQMVAPGRYALPQGGTPFPGAWVNIQIAKESREIQPGFYHVFSDVPLDDSTAGNLTRIYFNVDEAGAAPLVHAVTSTLNRLLVPFRMKTLSYRGLYTRSDAAVLFFSKRHFGIVARLLGRIRGAVRDHLRARTPLMTKRLHDGIGVAEDPGGGDSFGTHRCRLIAQAIWDAYSRGAHSEEARFEELALQFTRNGLAIDKPWLRSGSADIYELPEEA